MPKKELPPCPVETTLTLIGDKWKVLILRDLMPGTKRFGELKKSIGTVTQKVLTQQLRAMEESGLLTRKVYAEVPPRVEYTLTGERAIRRRLNASLKNSVHTGSLNGQGAVERSTYEGRIYKGRRCFTGDARRGLRL